MWAVVVALLLGIATHGCQPWLRTSHWYSQRVIVALPGSVQESRAWPFPLAVATPAGFAGIIVADASSEAVPLPVAFTARSSNA